MGYTKQAVQGVSWIGLLRVSTRLITFLRLFILGRILTQAPAQFGFFGIASLVLAFLEIITETGINIFLVQEKKDIREYIDSAWVVSIIRGILLSLLIFFLAPFIVSFFQAPGAYPVLLLMSIVPFIRGFINPAIVTFQKELQFNKEFWLRFILFAVDSVVVIVFAYLLRNATSFAFGLIASAVLEVILSFVLIPVKPKLTFHLEKVKFVIKKGWWVTLTSIFSYTSENGDNIVVGKILGSTSLGIYQVAYKISTLTISEITDVVNRVMFPVYVKFSDDRRRLLQAFLKVTAVSSFLAIMLGLGISVFAREIILILLGEQWTEAIPVIQILSIYGIIRTIFGNFSAVFLAVRRQDYVAKMTSVRVLGLLLSIVPLISFYGLVGAGYAVCISMLVEIPVVLYFAFRVFSTRPTYQEV